MPLFGVVCLKLHFSRQFINCQFESCLVLSAGPTETQNKQLRPLKDLFNVKNALVASKL